MPAWDLLPMDRYRSHNWHCFDNLDKRSPYSVIYTSLGCPFDCTFCSLKTLFGKRGIRYRSPVRVIEEIDYLVKYYNVKNIKILDECFVLNKKHVNAICDLIIERDYDLNIWAYSRIDTVNEDMLKKMKQAGFSWLAYGIESVSKNVLAGVDKDKYDKTDILNVLNITKDYGINVLANFMFGLPDDNNETMQETLDFAKELNSEYTNFYATMAYPGSQLYEDSLKKNIKLPESWIGYSQYSEETFPLPTKYLSGSEVLCFRDRAFEEYHGNPKYLDMINLKFGKGAVEHIKKMLEHKIKRKYA